MNWNPVELDYKSFYEVIESSNIPVFIDFWAAWCPPCRMMEPVFETLAREFEGIILVRKLNTDLYRKISESFNISGIPTYVVFFRGKEIWRKIGAVSQKKLKEIFRDILNEIDFNGENI